MSPPPIFDFLNSKKLDQVLANQRALMQALNYLMDKGDEIMASITDLVRAVEEQGTVIDSAIALINGLIAQINDLEPTQEAIDELVAAIDAKKQQLADAIEANVTPTPT